MTGETVHISSVLVRCTPGRLSEVAQAVGAYDLAEVVLTDPSGKIVVLLETDRDAAIADVLTQFQLLDGVVSAAMVYHQTCDAQELPTTIGDIR